MIEAPVLNLQAALQEIVLFISILVLMVVGAFREKDAARVVTPMALLVLVFTAMLGLGATRDVTAFSSHFIFDDFAAFMKLFILLGTAATILLAQNFLSEQKINRFEFPLLAMFSALGMCMMVSANSLLALYMALELQSLPLYVLAAYNRDNLRSTEAGLKYFVLGALASGMLLYGCSMIYGFTGTLNFNELAARIATDGTGGLSIGILVGLVFLVAGIVFKLGAVPFHMWTPDVYEGAPTPVTAFFASAPKFAAMGLALRVMMQAFGDAAAEWQQIIVFISVASMGLGAFAAIGQSNFKRLMAYSGISHVGYALVGLASGTEKGVYGVIVYMAIYMVTAIGTFGCILMMRRQGRYVETIADLAGLSKRQPLFAAALAIFMFSLAGIPPLAGFFGKLYVFMAAIDAGLTILAIIGVLTSVVGAYYYLRIVKIMYFDEAAEPFDSYPAFEVRLVSGLTAILLLGFIFMPGGLLQAAQAAATAIVR
ncbi:MAG: NADH-quinone oxidoreductase subunit NuoN [Geminicoccaceae bacterium]|nr:NADH-quinone oxidoreductase subunit NuoN [Geminicoccaceae bacterium]MCB9944947.1 NADH-quinone oxidoreductase subunit NuoN [Geminicoccaceae bacterium]